MVVFVRREQRSRTYIDCQKKFPGSGNSFTYQTLKWRKRRAAERGLRPASRRDDVLIAPFLERWCPGFDELRTASPWPANGSPLSAVAMDSVASIPNGPEFPEAAPAWTHGG